MASMWTHGSFVVNLELEQALKQPLKAIFMKSLKNGLCDIICDPSLLVPKIR